MGVLDLSLKSTLLGYGLLIIPLGIILWKKVPLFTDTVVALVRMSVQLLFVGLYLQVIFEINNPWINILWILMMISVADVSILRRCKLKVRRFSVALFVALFVGTGIPLVFIVGLMLEMQSFMDARYVVPISGMILGNCLRADVIGLSHFYDSLRNTQKSYLLKLSKGATLSEALGPYVRDSLSAALSPTVATMATIGLVSLPGMMTGVILGGNDPLVAIQYQIAIMIAIFTGTTVTVLLGVWLTTKSSFSDGGVLKKTVFRG